MVYVKNNQKICCTCKQLKSLDEFSKAASRTGGHACQCKKCCNSKAREKRRLQKKPKVINIISKICTKCGVDTLLSGFIRQKSAADGHRPECKVCSKRQNNPVRRNRLLQQNFGIDIIIYNQMSRGQNDVCAICNKPEPHNSVLAVDHDHATGKVRALLCSHCNMLLGNAFDSIDILTAAIQYLNKHTPT